MDFQMSDSGEAIPVANNSNLLYLSIGFLFTVFSIIGGFIVKLYYDEHQANLRAEADRMIRGEGEYRPPARNYGDNDESGDDDYYDESGDEREFKKKIGKKKAAKLQAKQEARIAREAELRAREERKQREAEEDKRRQEEREREELEEKKRQEEERIRREEREKRELEEYLKLKDSFVIEGEGQDAKSEEEQENMMKNFVDFIKKSKVVYLDELAPRFQLDVESAVEKIKFFMENGILTGVFDDRGKFIYISEEEMAAVAKFINQRGRISLQDLADYSNQLISFESRMGD